MILTRHFTRVLFRRMTLSSPSCTAFASDRLIAAGPVADVAKKVKRHLQRHPEAGVLVFDDATAEQVELDLRGTIAEVSVRIESPTPEMAPGSEEPRTRG